MSLPRGQSLKLLRAAPWARRSFSGGLDGAQSHTSLRLAAPSAPSRALTVVAGRHGSSSCSSADGSLTATIAAGAALAAAALGLSRPGCCEGVAAGPKEELVLSADCGGTTTRLRLYSVDPNEPVVEKQEAPGKLIIEEKFPNFMYAKGGLEEILEQFLEVHCRTKKPRVAVLAVAGIVTGNQCRFTNLDWLVDGNMLAEHLNISRVEVINDFVAQGYGTLTLGDEDLVQLNPSVKPRSGAPIACVGAGTGLGQCFLTSDPGGEYQCYPSEGGHVEFAPRGRGNDEEQIKLLQYLKIKFSGWNRISVERVVSGKGICNIYEYLAWKYPDKVDTEMHAEFLMKAGDAGVIAKHASNENLCMQALNIFAECYGATCGSMAIQFMPFRGLFITGGVSKKLEHLLAEDRGAFIRAFHDKGRVSPLVDQVPLYLVKSDDMGQRGAHLRSVRLLQECLAGLRSRVDESEHLDESLLVAPRNVVAYTNDSEARGSSVAELRDLVDFQLRNRRLTILQEEEAANAPVFKTMLWRVRRGGDPHVEEDWIWREMWIAKNGNFCFVRKATSENQVYLTRDDLETATIEPVNDSETSVKKHAFRVHVPGFESAIFAAGSKAGRECWMSELRQAKEQLESQSKE